MRSRISAGPVWAALAVLTLVAAPHQDLEAAPVSGIAGFDYYAGPEGVITRTALLGAEAGLGGFSASLAGLRFDDSVVGEGNGISAGLSVPLSLMTRFSLAGTRYSGEESFEALRVKAGPVVSLPRAGTLGVFYSRYSDNADQSVNSGSLELGVSLVAGLSARAAASYARADDDRKSTQGSIGLGWSPIRFVELAGDVGFATNGAVTSTPFLGRGLPLLGGGSGAELDTETTYQIGVRVVAP
jgi:hypothetical protein